MKLGKLIDRNTRRRTHEYQGGVEVLVVLLYVVHVVLGRLLPVHRVEIESMIVVFDGLEEGSESVLETGDPSMMSNGDDIYESESDAPLGIDSQWRRLFLSLFTLFGIVHDSLCAYGWDGLIRRMVLVELISK